MDELVSIIIEKLAKRAKRKPVSEKFLLGQKLGRLRMAMANVRRLMRDFKRKGNEDAAGVLKGVIEILEELEDDLEQVI